LPPDDPEVEIRRLLDQAESMPYGPDELALIRQAAALADESDDEDLAYEVQMRLTTSAGFAGDTDTMLSSFAWCLAKHDSDPDRFAAKANDGSDLLWQYKWMPEALLRSPAFSLKQIEALIKDMRKRYRQAGVGMGPVISVQWQYAWRSGQVDRAKELRAKLETAARDDYSDCEACSRSRAAAFALELGEDDRALALVDEITAKGLSCASEPEHALGLSLRAKLRANRLDDAKASHLRSYQLARLDPDSIATVADNLIFCAVTGNHARALAIVERHLHWLTHDTLNDASRLAFLPAIALALESVIQIGHGDQIVRGADRPELAPLLGLPVNGGPWTASGMVENVWASAERLATAFDERNGNDYVSQLLAKSHLILEETYNLPIQSNAFTTSPPPPAEEPEDLDELLGLAESCEMVQLHARQLNLANRIMAMTHDVDDRSDPRWPARLKAHELIIVALESMEYWDRMENAVTARIADMRRVGYRERADIEEYLFLSLYTGDDGGLERLQAAVSAVNDAISAGASPAEGLRDLQSAAAFCVCCSVMPGDDFPGRDQRVKELLALIEALNPADSIIFMRARLSGQLWFGSDMSEIVETLTWAVSLDLPLGFKAWYLQQLANVRGRIEEYDQAAAAADEATQIFASLGFIGASAGAAETAGRALGSAGRFDEAVSRLRYAMRLDELEGEQNPSSRLYLAKLLCRLDQYAEAAELLVDVLEMERARRAAPETIAEVLDWLGTARVGVDDPGGALRAWSEACDGFLAGQDLRSAANMRGQAGDLLRRLSAPYEAVREFDGALALLEQAGWRQNPNLHRDAMAALEERAFARASCEDEDAIIDIDTALQIAALDKLAWRWADLLDSKAHIVMRLGNPARATTEFLRTADAYRAAGDHVAAGFAGLSAARMLARRLDRPDEARAVLNTTLHDMENLTDEPSQESEELIEAIKASLASLR
jgi:tetratricopeptide (TPR) repeat protein